MSGNTKSGGLSRMQKIFGGLGIIGGIWLILAPFVLNYAGATVMDAKTKKPVPADLAAVTTTDIIAGVLMLGLVGFALLTANNAALAKVRFYASLVVVGLGVFLLVAPYLYDLLKVAEYLTLDKPNTNDQLMGLVTIVLGGFAFQTSFLPEPVVENTDSKVAITA